MRRALAREDTVRGRVLPGRAGLCQGAGPRGGGSQGGGALACPDRPVQRSREETLCVRPWGWPPTLPPDRRTKEGSA